ncbi:MAG TPA: hypothetical protein VF594_04150, partial [Rubricoccaceae bacterium]
MTALHLVLLLLVGVTACAVLFAVTALVLHVRGERAEARQTARAARWEPVLLDVLVGDVEPGVFAERFVRRHHGPALALAATYALRLDGESLARLGEAMAPLLPRARALLHARRSDRR